MRRPRSSVRTACVALLALCGAATVGACPYPDPGKLVTPEQLVDGARDVTVARVEQATATNVSEVRYDFVVLERLAGPVRERFSITAQSHPADEVLRSYDHSDEAFWQPGGGRLNGEGSRCWVTPRFDVGQTYLVFQDQRPTFRSFERILVQPRGPISIDKWYTWVVERLRTRPQP